MTLLKYVPAFDGIRCLAVVFVLLIHGNYGHFRGGWIGVDLFFVLSGYLITTSLQKEYQSTGNIDLKNFYIRRGLRLFPALLLGVGLGNLLWTHTLSSSLTPNRMVATLASLFYAASFISPDYMGNLGPLWSLATEEHFYFIWPFILLLFLSKISPKNQAILLIVSLIAITFFRIHIFDLSTPIKLGLFHIDSYRFTFCRIDAILLGAALALFQPAVKPGAHIPMGAHVTGAVLFALLLLVLLLVDASTPLWNRGGFIFTNLLCLTVVWFALRFPQYPLLANRVVRWIGHRSYGIYMYNLPIFLLFDSYITESNPLNTLFVNTVRFSITFVLAGLSYRFVEQPILRYGKQKLHASLQPA